MDHAVSWVHAVCVGVHLDAHQLGGDALWVHGCMVTHSGCMGIWVHSVCAGADLDTHAP